MRVRKLASCLCWAVLGAAAHAKAQSADSAGTASAPAPLSLELRLDGATLDPEAIRKAVELELKRPVELATPSASRANESGQRLSVVAHSNHTVTISYRAANGVLRTRSIGIPQDPARSAEVIALLSGNLSRDEAAELLAALAAKPQPAPNTPSAGETKPDAVSAAAAKSAPQPEAAPQPDVAKPQPTAKPTPPPARDLDPLLTTRYPYNLSFFAPIALYPDAARRKLTLELGFAYSHVGALHGVGLNVFVLDTERDLRGVSLATLYNRTGGSATGITLAALVNRTRRVDGGQISGIVNLGSSEAQGFSLAGVANVQSGDMYGVQVAGILNRADKFQGLQLAGATNVASELNGLQIGLVNVAGNVRGAQIGLVNVAKHVDGTSIGLVSVADNGRLQPVLWASTLLPINLGMKFTVGPIYTQLAGGYSPGNQTYDYELGLGGHFPIGRFFLEPGIHYSEMRSAKRPFEHELLEHGHYRLAGGVDLGRVSPFLGVAILQRFAHSSDAPSSTPVTVEGFAGLALF